MTLDYLINDLIKLKEMYPGSGSKEVWVDVDYEIYKTIFSRTRDGVIIQTI
jgi:hypothetical protein